MDVNINNKNAFEPFPLKFSYYPVLLLKKKFAHTSYIMIMINPHIFWRRLSNMYAMSSA